MGPIDSLGVVGINLRLMTRLALGVLPIVHFLFPFYKIFLFVNFGVCVLGHVQVHTFRPLYLTVPSAS